MMGKYQLGSSPRWTIGRVLCIVLVVVGVIQIIIIIKSFNPKKDLILFDTFQNLKLSNSNHDDDIVERLSDTKLPPLAASTTNRRKINYKNVYKQLSPLYRIGVVTYISEESREMNTFTTMLFGSWRYITIHKGEIFSRKEVDSMNIIDLFVVAHTSLASEIPSDCRRYSTNNTYVPTSHKGNNKKSHYVKYNRDKNKTVAERDGISGMSQRGPICWRLLQEPTKTTEYERLNSILLFQQQTVHHALRRYDYIFYTTPDTFLSPSLFTLNLRSSITTDISVGMRQNCDYFNKRRLQLIAAKLNMTHKDVSCLGDSVFGETRIVTNIMRKVWDLAQNIYHNEFRNGLPGLEHIEFKKNPNGQFPQWYRPDSLKYGLEIALNNYIDGFSYDNLQNIDKTTCLDKPITSQLSVKCYNVDCSFNRQKFLATIDEFQTGFGRRKEELLVKVRGYMTKRNATDIRKLTVPEYADFIGWYSAGKYVRLVKKHLSTTLKKNKTKKKISANTLMKIIQSKFHNKSSEA